MEKKNFELLMDCFEVLNDYGHFELCSGKKIFDNEEYSNNICRRLDETFFKVNALTQNKQIYKGHKLDELFSKDDEITCENKFNNIKHISIYNSDANKELNFKKLKFLNNLESLQYNNPRLLNIPEEFFELINLKELTISILGFYEKNYLSDLSNIKKLTNLSSLSLCIITKEFPREILQLKQLRILRLATFFEIQIPDEICNLENLFILDVGPSKINEIYSYKNKMIISHIDYLEYINYITSETITDLKILDCGMKDLIDLPDDLEVLRLGINVGSLSNLPINLKKLYIWDFCKTFSKDNVKLPFGCELILIN